MDEELRSDVLEQLEPIDYINGFGVMPGLYQTPGATAVPGGVNFTVCSMQATSCELVLYHRKARKPYAILPFPESYKIGNTYAMIVFHLDISEMEYVYRMDGPYLPERGLLFDPSKDLLDPYAKAVAGQSMWGQRREDINGYRARVVADKFHWGNSVSPEIPLKDLVIYELHVRGFTNHPDAEVAHPGTFAGLREKIPYLKDLGINAVELMPVFEFDELEEGRVVDGERLYNYWGYNPVCFFAPNTSYTAHTEYNREGTELKSLIRELHSSRMEVILDVVFNHTAEGDERGPYISFKGIDNNIYYILTPEGNYYNFSGCGNTLNCNHPVVQQMILNCLRHWVIEFRVDGFRFDLASILGRDETGAPMSNPPLLRLLAMDPILSKVKLIAEAWDAGGLYQVGTFPSWRRWAEWNGKYRDDLRRFLKGDSQMAWTAAQRITGSLDIYDPAVRGEQATVNFITCHDGFTLYDLYSYNEKHNEKNGWNNMDGENCNNSWNCGEEGETENKEILALRERLCKNAYAVLLCSRGAAMVRAGDEFGNTQYGNNNAYCQDNEISWLKWKTLKKHRNLYELCRFLIHFRMEHPVLRGKNGRAHCGLPDISFHGTKPWKEDFASQDRLLGIMFAGRDAADSTDDIVYIAMNMFWEDMEMTLPRLTEGFRWRLVADTYEEQSVARKEIPEEGKITARARSVLVIQAVRAGIED